MEISCPLIEKAQSSDRCVKYQNAQRSQQRATFKTSAIAAVAASSLGRSCQANWCATGSCRCSSKVGFKPVTQPNIARQLPSLWPSHKILATPTFWRLCAVTAKSVAMNNA